MCFFLPIAFLFLKSCLCSLTAVFSTCPPASSFSSLSYFRPLMLPLTCTVSMVCQRPETQAQLSMVTRSVYRLFVSGFSLFPCVEVKGSGYVSHPLFQLCGSLGSITQQLYRRVGSQMITFLTVLNTGILTHTSTTKRVCHMNPDLMINSLFGFNLSQLTSCHGWRVCSDHDTQ